MEWVGGNFGSNVTMLYPCSVLVGENSSADHLGVAFANHGQIQDTGAKVIHLAPNTTSNIVMKSVSKSGGAAIYRGLVDIGSAAENAVSNIKCDALILDDISSSDTVPMIKIKNSSALLVHEASAGKLSEDDIFYLRSRGGWRGDICLRRQVRPPHRNTKGPDREDVLFRRRGGQPGWIQIQGS
jgi:Fe-S cluster assembly protein SufB